MTNEDLMAEKISSEILKSGVTLPPVPTAASRLLAFAQKSQDEIDINSFVQLVDKDPSLVTKILQLANSPYYGSINPIIGLRKAIIQIGLEESVNLINLFFFQNSFPKFPLMKGFSSKGYWAHSWACGQANRMLGHPRYQVKVNPGELYIAGLLHGIGKLILAIYRPDDFLECINNARFYEEPLASIEMNIFGTTDSLIASKFMETWNLPANICAAVRGYHSPGSVEPEYREIAALTQFSYYNANISEIGDSGDKFCVDLSQTWISQKWTTPLADKAKQEKIVQEIISNLQKKAVSVTGVEQKEQIQEDRPKPKKSSLTKRTSTAPKLVPKKKGLISWIRSVLWQ